MRHRPLALSAAAVLLAGVAATPATAAVPGTDLGPVDLRVTVTLDDGDPTTDDTLVAEATGVDPAVEGPALTEDDVVSNPAGLCLPGLQFDPSSDAIVLGGFFSSETCLATSVEIEITSDELEQVVPFVDYLALREGAEGPVIVDQVDVDLTSAGVTLRWDSPDGEPFISFLALLGYVTEQPFADVTTGNEFAWHIQLLATQDVVEGYDDGTYRPTSAVSRQAMAAFLFRIGYFGETEYVAPDVSPFTDVATDHPFYAEIAWLAEEGIATGTVVGDRAYFRPAEPVSRQAMAAFLYRAGGVGEPAVVTGPSAVVEGSPFVDVDPSNTFFDEIVWLAESGISTGTVTPEGALFRPTAPVSRQAMAAFLVRDQFGAPFGVLGTEAAGLPTLESLLG